jgi:hypothetical protein
MGRRTRTKLPIKSSLLRPTIPKDVKNGLEKRKEKAEFYYNRNAKDLNELDPGDTVRIRPSGNKQNWTKAKVNGKLNIRSYQVTTEDGRTYRRNRKHLRVSHEPYEECLTSPSIDHKSDEDHTENCENPLIEKTNHPETPARRYPKRKIKMPDKFNDFLLYK